jgi:hypothetical protein
MKSLLGDCVEITNSTLLYFQSTNLHVTALANLQPQARAQTPNTLVQKIMHCKFNLLKYGMSIHVHVYIVSNDHAIIAFLWTPSF